MRIRDILSETYKQFCDEKTRNYKFIAADDRLLFKRAIYLDRKYILNALDKIFKNTYEGTLIATAVDLKPFKDLLAERWEYLRHTNLAYNYAPQSPINRILITLAYELYASEFYEVHPLKLLMPSIKTFNEVTLTDLIDSEREFKEPDQLNLNRFILSDDDTALISVSDCISDMKEDGILKHTSQLLNNKKAMVLSEDESVRVIHHSNESKSYYDCVKNLYEVKTNGESLGAALKRLIAQLRAGGERGGRDGQAMIAGSDAIRGIKDFYNFLKILNDREKEQILFTCSSFRNANGSSFEFCWYQLLNRAAIEGHIQIPDTELFTILEFLSNPVHATTQVPCVELLAGDLERILINHDELYEIYPEDKVTAAEMSIKVCEARIAEAKNRFYELSKYENFQTNLHYGEDGNLRLMDQFYRALIKTPQHLKSILNDLSFSLHKRLLNEILQTARLKTIIRSFADLKSILCALKELESYELIFQSLGKIYLCELIRTSDDLNELFKILTRGQAIAFLTNYLDKQEVKRIFPNNTTDEVTAYFFDGEVLKKLLKMLDLDSNVATISDNYFTIFNNAPNINNVNNPLNLISDFTEVDEEKSTPNIII